MRHPRHLKMVIPHAPWTQALQEGRITIPGATYECMPDIGHAPQRFIATLAEDSAVGENGVRRLLLEMEGRADPTGLPVFFGRELMQRNFLVRKDSPLKRPEDLIGKRVGSRLGIASGTGIGVLTALEAGYGLDLRRIVWHMGRPASLPVNRMELNLNRGPSTDEEGLAAVESGVLDAVVVTTDPRYWSVFGTENLSRVQCPANLRPLIEEPEAMARVYRRTGIYPITDTTVVKPWVAEDPDLPRAICHAFAEANKLASEYRDEAENALARREIDLMGEDPHTYGLGPNQRRNLAALIGLLYRIGAINSHPEPEALFVSSSL